MDESCDEEPGASSNIELRAQGGGDEEKEQTEADLEQRSGQRIPLSTEESICRGEQGSYRDRGTRLFPTISIEKMCSLNALPNGVLERFFFFSDQSKCSIQMSHAPNLDWQLVYVSSQQSQECENCISLH